MASLHQDFAGVPPTAVCISPIGIPYLSFKSFAVKYPAALNAYKSSPVAFIQLPFDMSCLSSRKSYSFGTSNIRISGSSVFASSSRNNSTVLLSGNSILDCPPNKNTSPTITSCIVLVSSAVMVST